MTAAAPARALPTGIGVQVYLDALTGKTRAARLDEVSRGCAALAKAGVTWVAWHGFSTTLTPDVFGALEQRAHGFGLASWAAYGIDSDDMRGKGQRIGAVLRMPECAGGIIDGETKLEDESPGAERDHARELRVTLRGDGTTANPGTAPDATIIVQWWELPQFHSGYPYDELALLSDVVAPMEYLNNWKRTYGTKRAAIMERRWAEGRAWVQRRLLPIARPFFRTTHAVGWDDIPGDLDAMCAAHADRLLVWSEAWPDAKFLAAIKRAVGAHSAAQKAPA